MNESLIERLRKKADVKGLNEALFLEAAAELEKMSAEVAEVRLALADAAREINVAGPVDHRIRILKQEHADAVARLSNFLIKLRAAIDAAIEGHKP